MIYKGRIIIFHIDFIFKHLSLSSGTKMGCKKTRKQMEKHFYNVWNVKKLLNSLIYSLLIKEVYIAFSLLLYNVFYHQSTTLRTNIIKYHHIFSSAILGVMSSWFSLVFISLSACRDITDCWHILDTVKTHACLGDR